MKLIIDIGNTLIKFALFKGQTFLVKNYGSVSHLNYFIKSKNIKKAIISSVAQSTEVENILKKHQIDYIYLNANTTIPIKNKYTTPNTLGYDRLANVVGANALFPNKNVLTIDCGTCIKFDAITTNKEYYGGSISPGLSMRFKALNHFTHKLPLLKYQKIDFLIGNSSNNAILAGVIKGCIAEIDGFINQYNSIYKNLTIIMTGGDAKYFENELKNNIFVNSTLTLIGLNEILLYND